MINESNYHIFLDDFVAGLLDEELEMEFVAFLDQHPGILEEETLEVADIHLASSFQASLKKEIPLDAQHIDEFLIASLEGDLSISQENQLAQFLVKHPQYLANKELIQLTKLEVDTALVFANKSSLKKRPAIYLYTRWAASAAAVFILGLMLFRFLGGGGIPEQELAEVPVPSIHPTELPSITVSAGGNPIVETAESPSQIKKQRALVADNQATKHIKEVLPQQVKNQEPDSYALEIPKEQDWNLLPVAISAPSLLLEQQLASNSTELTVFQWAYKKLRGKIGVPEQVIPERDIPKDMVNIVMAKVAPVFQVEPNGAGSRIRIGGLEINHRSAH